SRPKSGARCEESFGGILWRWGLPVRVTPLSEVGKDCLLQGLKAAPEQSQWDACFIRLAGGGLPASPFRFVKDQAGGGKIPRFSSEAGRSLRDVLHTGCHGGIRNESFTLRSAGHCCCCLLRALSGAVRTQGKFWFCKGKPYWSLASSSHRSARTGREPHGNTDTERTAGLHARRPYVSAAHVP